MSWFLVLKTFKTPSWIKREQPYVPIEWRDLQIQAWAPEMLNLKGNSMLQSRNFPPRKFAPTNNLNVIVQ